MIELNDPNDEEEVGYKVNTSVWNFDDEYLILSWQGGKWNLDLVDFCKYLAINQDGDVALRLKKVLEQCLYELNKNER